MYRILPRHRRGLPGGPGPDRVLRVVQRRPASASPAPASNPDQVVAEVAGTVDHAQRSGRQVGRVRRRRARARRPRRCTRTAATCSTRWSARSLIENAAKAAGQSVDAYLAQDSAKRADAGDRSGGRAVLRANRIARRAAPSKQLRGADQAVPRKRSRKQQARAQLVRRAEGEERQRRQGDARSAALHRADDRQRSGARRRVRAGDDRRVLRLPVPVLRARQPDARSRCARPTATRSRSSSRTYPLPNHPQAPKAAEAAHCAGEQRQVLGDARRDVRQPAGAERAGAQAARARTLGLDGAKFDQCLDSGKHAGARARPAPSSASGWASIRRRRSTSTAGP